jgi:hypothetical protein
MGAKRILGLARSHLSNEENMTTLADSILIDFHRLSEQEETRFDADDFIEYAKTRDYTTEYASHKAGFIRKKLAEEHFLDQKERQRGR